jgi:hypothetical protein
MAVLGRDESMPPTTSTLLQTLAAADLLSIVFSIPLTSQSHITVYTFSYFVKPWLTVVCRPLQSTTFTASVWMQVLVTAERYVAVCYPMHVSRVVTLSRTRKTIVVVWLLAAAFNVCRGFEDHVFNYTSETLWVSAFGLKADKAYHIAYNMIVYPAVTLVLPFVLLVFFTVRILRGLKKSFKEQLALTSADEQKQKKLASKQRRTTATLVSIVVIFLCCQTVLFAGFIYSFNVPVIIFYSQTWQTVAASVSQKIDTLFTSLAYLFISLQSALNFFIYCVTGQRYRQAVIEAFACKR